VNFFIHLVLLNCFTDWPPHLAISLNDAFRDLHFNAMLS
jgi:hypothetical protein